MSDERQRLARKAAHVAILATSATVTLLAASPAQATGTYGYSSAQERNSGAATTNEVVRSITGVVTSQIANRVAAAIQPGVAPRRADAGQTGVAAGDSATDASAWGSASGTRLRNTLASTRYRADLGTLMAGADATVNDWAVVGATLVGETAAGDTSFNDGAFNREGVSLVPYAAFRLSDDVTLTTMAGYGFGMAQNGRNFGGRHYSAQYHFQRLMGSTELAYQWNTGDLSLTPKLGYTYAMERNTSYREIANTGDYGATVASRWDPLGEARAGLRAGYVLGAFEPYVQASYVYDNVMRRQSTGAGAAQPSNDQDEVLFQLGLVWQPTATFSGALELTQSAGRADTSESTISLNLRLHL